MFFSLGPAVMQLAPCCELVKITLHSQRAICHHRLGVGFSSCRVYDTEYTAQWLNWLNYFAPPSPLLLELAGLRTLCHASSARCLQLFYTLELIQIPTQPTPPLPSIGSHGINYGEN